MNSHLTEIAIVVLVALMCGLGLMRFKQPPILGYIVAGIFLGPSGLSLVENREHVSLLAELGVLLLLFLVGMELNIREFKRVWPVALLATLLQILGSFAITSLLSFIFGWTLAVSFFVGCVIALSSTAVAVKMLENTFETDTKTGRLTIAILIAQDLALVPIILIIRGLSRGSVIEPMIFIKIIISVVIIAGLIIFLGKREALKFPLPKSIEHSNSEIIPLMVLAFCFCAASLAGVLGLSAAYGAFLAGFIIGNTHIRSMMIKVTHPIQSVLIMVFFLSIGLLLNIHYIWENLTKVLLFLTFITVGKTLLNTGILKLLGQPLTVAFLASIFLAQIGEFSFLLITVADETSLITKDFQQFVIALTVLSLLFSPIWMSTARRLHGMAPSTFVNGAQLLSKLYSPEIKGMTRWFQQKYKNLRNYKRSSQKEEADPSGQKRIEEDKEKGSST